MTHSQTSFVAHLCHLWQPKYALKNCMCTRISSHFVKFIDNIMYMWRDFYLKIDIRWANVKMPSAEIYRQAIVLPYLCWFVYTIRILCVLTNVLLESQTRSILSRQFIFWSHVCRHNRATDMHIKISIMIQNANFHIS